MLLMSLFHLLDPLQMTRRIKLTSQNLKVIETRNIPDGTPATYKKCVEEETMGYNTLRTFPGVYYIGICICSNCIHDHNCVFFMSVFLFVTGISPLLSSVSLLQKGL